MRARQEERAGARMHRTTRRPKPAGTVQAQTFMTELEGASNEMTPFAGVGAAQRRQELQATRERRILESIARKERRRELGQKRDEWRDDAKGLLVVVVAIKHAVRVRARFRELLVAKRLARRQLEAKDTIYKAWAKHRARRTWSNVNVSSSALRKILMSLRLKGAQAQERVRKRKAADMLVKFLGDHKSHAYMLRPVGYFRLRVSMCQRFYRDYASISRGRRRALLRLWNRSMARLNRNRLMQQVKVLHMIRGAKSMTMRGIDEMIRSIRSVREFVQEHIQAGVVDDYVTEEDLRWTKRRRASDASSMPTGRSEAQRSAREPQRHDVSLGEKSRAGDEKVTAEVLKEAALLVKRGVKYPIIPKSVTIELIASLLRSARASFKDSYWRWVLYERRQRHEANVLTTDDIKAALFHADSDAAASAIAQKVQAHAAIKGAPELENTKIAVSKKAVVMPIFSQLTPDVMEQIIVFAERLVVCRSVDRHGSGHIKLGELKDVIFNNSAVGASPEELYDEFKFMVQAFPSAKTKLMTSDFKFRLGAAVKYELALTPLWRRIMEKIVLEYTPPQKRTPNKE